MKKNHPLLLGIDSVTPYRTVTGDSLYSIRPPAMQIEQFLTVGGVMGMTSYPGVGKTWLALEVARAVASGTPFLGRHKTTRGGVLFVGSDASVYDYAQQWTRLTRATPDAADTFEPVRFLLQSTFMFEDRDEVRKLIQTHRKYEWGALRNTDAGPERERGFHVIIFDTLSRLTRANQNDNTEMEEVFRNIRWLAEATDAAIILLHHNSKKSEFNDGSDWRGALSQIGALDSWVQLSPAARDKFLVGVQFKKFRGITPPDFAYQMHVMERESASLVYSDRAVTREQIASHDTLSEAIKEFLRQHPGSRTCEVRDALWDRFHVGVAGYEGKTVSFATKDKFQNAVYGRVTLLHTSGKIKRDVNAMGKAVYHALEEAAQEVQAGPEVPAPSVGGDAPPPRRKKARKREA